MRRVKAARRAKSPPKEPVEPEPTEAAVPAGTCFVVKFTLPEGEEELAENWRGGTVHVRGVNRTFPDLLGVGEGR